MGAVLCQAGAYQTTDEIAAATAFWPNEAGQRLGLLRAERLVAMLIGDHKKQESTVRDSRVKSYTITPAGLAYLQAAPPEESRKLNIETRRTEKELPVEERRRAVRLRMNATDPKPNKDTR